MKLRPRARDAGKLWPASTHTSAVPRLRAVSLGAGPITSHPAANGPPRRSWCGCVSGSPVVSEDECKALYLSTCNTGFEVIKTPDMPDGYCYDTDCPCFDSSVTTTLGLSAEGQAGG